MGYEYVKRLVQGKPSVDPLYEMKSGVSGPGFYPEVLMNFYDFCLCGDPSVGMTLGVNRALYTPSLSGPALVLACHLIDVIPKAGKIFQGDASGDLQCPGNYGFADLMVDLTLVARFFA
jgi:hypothetical protein